jgi:hypothetical protein
VDDATAGTRLFALDGCVGYLLELTPTLTP